MNSAKALTVHFLPELAPSLEAKAAAKNLFDQQCGAAPAEFYFSKVRGIWGWLGDGAVLLFQVPKDWIGA